MSLRFLSLSVLVLPLALAVFPGAQAQGPPQAPNAVPAKTGAPEKPADTALAVDRQQSSGPDARVCLEFPTTAQVIMCAEKYRPRKRQA